MATTTPATATGKKSAEIVYDFDSWTPEQEDAALAAIAGGFRHIIVENRFIGRFSDGELVELPLTLTLDVVDEVDAKELAPVDQLKHIIRTVGGEAAVKAFVTQPLVETSIAAKKYFEMIHKIAQASFPE